tara:strand:+ start:358 stop:636 length:279 start_codon:yes stop_codon:yes gene_type:complete
MDENKNDRYMFAYIAGLIDGEGCITYTQQLQHRKGKPRAYKYWNIRIEVAMTHKETIEYLQKHLVVDTLISDQRCLIKTLINGVGDAATEMH